MTLIPAAFASSSLLTHLAVPAIRALMLAGVAALGLSIFRVKATPLRLFTWTAVLYGALAMPLLGWILPSLPVLAPAFLQYGDVLDRTDGIAVSNPATILSSSKKAFITAAERTTRKSSTKNMLPSSVSVKGSAQPEVTPVSLTQNEPTSSPASPHFWLTASWSVLTGVYVFVALLLLARIIIGVIFGRWLIRSSHEVRDARFILQLASRSYACGLSIAPAVAESELISVPVTMGILRPTILVPTDWREWDSGKLDAVVAHEVSHVARRDALTQRLSLLHRAIFWFSPFTWWLDRHLADLAEQASDEAALSCGADRNDYAQTLLEFFEALQAAPGRVWWQAVSMAKTGEAEKRLERILAWKEAKGAVTMSSKNSGLKKSIAVAVITLAVPVVYLAAAVRPVGHDPRSQNTKIAQDQVSPTAPVSGTTTAPAIVAEPQDASATSQASAPAPALAPFAPGSMTAPVSPLNSGISNPSLLTTQPMAPRDLLAPRVLAELVRQRQSLLLHAPLALLPRHNYQYSYGFDDDDELRFVIVTGQSDSVTMSGTIEDARHAEKLKKHIAGDFIWFESDGKSYIIRDQATIDRVRKLWAPQDELGRKQEELGKRQEDLGKQQEALSERMQEVHVKVPDMTAALDKLKAELKALGSGATMEQVDRIQSEIAELQDRIGEIQSQAGDEQTKIGEEMSTLGEKESELGEEQDELGRQQDELARQATHEMKELLDEAIKNGTAKPEPETGGGASL